MVICLEIDPRTKDELDELIEAGRYRDASQAVAVAISNQLLLDRNSRKSGRPVTLINSSVPTPQQNSSQASISIATSDTPRTTSPDIPAVFSLVAASVADYQPAPLPGDAFIPGQDVPVDRWIFGQHNKLLPVKASCRALVALSSDRKGMPLSKVAPEIAALAVGLGDYLKAIDEEGDAGRDELLSTAFPHSGADAGDKARLRYANQFVGSVNRHGQLSGLLVDLKLVNHTGGKEPRIRLTEPGLSFAALRNPTLERDPGLSVTRKFSDEETGFLLAHIRKSVPVEYSGLRTTLAALSEGFNTPEKLDGALKKFLSKRSEKPFSDSFVTTQRSGVISRMADLNLIERKRDGINVVYVPTELGKQYLNESLQREIA